MKKELKHIKKFESSNFEIKKYHSIIYDGNDFKDIYFNNMKELENIMGSTKKGRWNHSFIDLLDNMDKRGTPFIFIIDPYQDILNKEKTIECLYKHIDGKITPMTKEEVITHYNYKRNMGNEIKKFQ